MGPKRGRRSGQIMAAGAADSRQETSGASQARSAGSEAAASRARRLAERFVAARAELRARWRIPTDLCAERRRGPDVELPQGSQGQAGPARLLDDQLWPLPSDDARSQSAPEQVRTQGPR